MDCGPSNAVKNLAQYSQRDNSIQNDVIRTQQVNPRQFKQGPMVDANLNQQFQQFGGNQFASQFMEQFGPQAPQEPRGVHMNHRQQMPQAPQVGPQQKGWVNDFSNMSLDPQQQQQQRFAEQFAQQQYNQQFDQHQQFGNQQFDQHQQFGNQQFGNQQFGNQQFNQTPRFHMNTRTDLQTRYEPNRQDLTEHQQMHRPDHQHDEFHQQLENEFEQVEQQLQNDGDKEEFARTAHKIHTSLNTVNQDPDMTDKIKNSQFMKLMNSISNRQVELSQEGDKLVDAQGEDIRTQEEQEAPDQVYPQSDVNYHRPQYETGHVSNSHVLSQDERSEQLLQREQFMAEEQRTRELQEQQNNREQQRQSQPQRPDQISHLPDPLAHIQDGALEGINEPFKAAQVISGNQVKMDSWLEEEWESPSVRQQRLDHARQREYDAYRHDDDYT